MNENAPFPKTTSEMEEDEGAPDFATLPLDEVVLKEMRKSRPAGSKAMFSKDISSAIITSLEAGASLNTASLASRMTPAVVYHWFHQGQIDFDAISEEDVIQAYEEGRDIEELYSDYAKFYIDVNMARARSVVHLQEGLYEKALEGGKEHIAMFLLERMEPEYYNLKRKISADVDADVQGKAKIQFTFVDGKLARPEEDQEFIDEQLSELAQQYHIDEEE